MQLITSGWFPLVICAILVLQFFFLFLYLFTKLSNQVGKSWEFTFVLSLFSLSISVGYLFWLIRIIFFPSDSLSSAWIWFWKLSTLMHMLASLFLGAFLLIYSPIKRPKILYVFFFIPFSVALISLFLVINQGSLGTTLYFGINNVSQSSITIILGIIIFIYTVLPVYNFLNYIRLHPNKKSVKRKKAYILLLNFIVFATLLSIETAKIAFIVTIWDGLGLQFIRIGVLINGIILFWSLNKYQIKDDYSFNDKLARVLPIVP